MAVCLSLLSRSTVAQWFIRKQGHVSQKVEFQEGAVSSILSGIAESSYREDCGTRNLVIVITLATLARVVKTLRSDD